MWLAEQDKGSLRSTFEQKDLVALPSAEKKLVIVPTDRVCCGYGVKIIEMQTCSRCKGDMQRALPFCWVASCAWLHTVLFASQSSLEDVHAHSRPHVRRGVIAGNIKPRGRGCLYELVATDSLRVGLMHSSFRGCCDPPSAKPLASCRGKRKFPRNQPCIEAPCSS